MRTMLVLSRHINERVVIGTPPNQVVVTLIEIRGDKIRLGFEAPANIPIHRQEIYNAIQRDGQKKPPLDKDKQCDGRKTT
jgi:carbon storage regulator